MSSTFRTIFVIAIFALFLSNQTKAQPRTGKSIDVAVGYGLSSPYDNVDITGNGFYTQGEYVIGLTKWFGIRPYAGLILTSADKTGTQQNQPDYKVTSNAFLLGGKVRVAAPIPWIAPYFEVGIGASIGSFVTYTPLTNVKQNGILMHIPWSIGLALGRKHNFEIAFTYYDHPSVDQTCGAADFGFSFPLN